MVSNISEDSTALHLSLKIGAAGFFKTVIITDDTSVSQSRRLQTKFLLLWESQTPYNYPIIPLHAKFIRTAAWHM